jgi:hypothetical protein
MSETDYTTITVREETKQRLDEHRDGRPWDQYLETLRREHADPITINDADELAKTLAAHIDYPEQQDLDTIARRLEALESIESRVGSIERTLEGLQR